MSYAGLGAYKITVKTPVGEQTISVPLQEMAAEAVNIGISELKKQLPGLLDQASNHVTTKLWPEMRPKIQAEVDVAMKKAQTMADGEVDKVTSRAGMLVGALALSVVGAAIYLKKKS